MSEKVIEEKIVKETDNDLTADKSEVTSNEWLPDFTAGKLKQKWELVYADKISELRAKVHDTFQKASEIEIVTSGYPEYVVKVVRDDLDRRGFTIRPGVGMLCVSLW